jgi:hypothetical protein
MISTCLFHDKTTPTRLTTAARRSHNEGAALLPVYSMSNVQTAGVKPPKSAVARL